MPWVKGLTLNSHYCPFKLDIAMGHRLEFEAKKDGRTIFLFLLHRQAGTKYPTQDYILTKVLKGRSNKITHLPQESFEYDICSNKVRSG